MNERMSGTMNGHESGNTNELPYTSRGHIVWPVLWVAGLAFLLFLQVPGPHRKISSEYLFPEIASRLFVSMCFFLSFIWAYHLYLKNGLPRLDWPRGRFLPFLFILAFGALFYYENNWDLEMREQTWGIAVAGVTLLPLLLLPVVWYRRFRKGKDVEKKDASLGLLLSMSGLVLMGFSQILDYHHDHRDRGIVFLRELGGIRGFEECLEYLALLAIFQSLIMLAVVRNAAAEELVKSERWKRLVVAVSVMSVGNGFWLGREWDGWWLYFHALGLVLALVGFVLSVRELRSFVRESKSLKVGGRIEPKLTSS